MFHKLRQWHRWIGLINSLFLLLISVTGFLLALKGVIPWMRPPENSGVKIESYGAVVSVDQAMKAAFAQGIPDLQNPKQVDRVDYRPKRNMYKVLSKEGFHEVQVDGSTGKVLQVASRNDSFTESLHDLSFFKEEFRTWVLPFVALMLTALAVTGICIWTVPILRRRKFAASKAAR